jgi:hypothetical protein
VPCFWEFIAILFFTVIAGHEPQSVYAMMFVPVFYFLPSLRATTRNLFVQGRYFFRDCG